MPVLPTTSALTENELFTHEDENYESDPSPAEQIKNIAECFDKLHHIRQLIRNGAMHSDDAVAHCDWFEITFCLVP